jgi:signal transduction histidine kinase
VATPVREESGPIVGVIATLRDITRLKKLDEARNQFIANISHELGTPLTNLKLYLDLLDKTPLSEKGQRYTAVLHHQTKHLETLVQGVVDLARLDSIHASSEWQPLTLDGLITIALSEYKPLITQRQLRVEVTSSPTPCPTCTAIPPRYGKPLLN